MVSCFALLTAFLRESRLAIEGLEHVHEKTGDGLKKLKSFVQDLEEKLST